MNADPIHSRKAFRGEGVATEAELAAREVRDFETAGQLLARIKLARAEKPAPSKPRAARLHSALPNAD